MAIDRKLSEWQQAGLIDTATLARIAAYEQQKNERSSPLVLYTVGGVGALAIVLGLVAIVSANWAEISGSTKLAIDLLVGLAIAGLLLRAPPGWVRELLLVLYYGFVLGSIALIGQIYQLESALWRALATWSVATFPFMLMVERRIAATLWLAGLASTHAAAMGDLMEWLDQVVGLAVDTKASLGLVLVAISPWPYLLFGRLRSIRRDRPRVSGVFWTAGWLGIAMLVLCGAGLFYFEFSAEELPRWGALVALALWSIGAALLPRVEPTLSPRALFGLRGLLVGGALVALVAVAVEREAWPLAAALCQIALLAAMAWASLQAGSRAGFRLGTAAVCVRLLIVYIEVFGSLLETGLGLILGGALAIGLCWWWVKRSRQLEVALGPASGTASSGSPRSSASEQIRSSEGERS